MNLACRFRYFAMHPNATHLRAALTLATDQLAAEQMRCRTLAASLARADDTMRRLGDERDTLRLEVAGWQHGQELHAEVSRLNAEECQRLHAILAGAYVRDGKGRLRRYGAPETEYAIAGPIVLGRTPKPADASEGVE